MPTSWPRLLFRRCVVTAAPGTSGSGRKTPFSNSRLAFETPTGGRALRPASEPRSIAGSTRGSKPRAGVLGFAAAPPEAAASAASATAAASAASIAGRRIM